jgi:hypothetical protein
MVLRCSAVLVLALVAAGCGSSNGGSKGGDDRLNLTTPSSTATPSAPSSTSSSSSPAVGKGVTRREAAVIRGWADTLRAGHVRRAARYFALPSVVENGTGKITLSTRTQVEYFNDLLTCGAKVVALKRTRPHRVLATFRLTDRPGGGCGGGTGHYAHTAFEIRNGLITQWLRADDPADGPQTSPS